MLVWFGYCIGMVLILFWYVVVWFSYYFGIVLVLFWYGWRECSVGLVLVSCWCRVGIVLVSFWCGICIVLLCCQYGSGMVFCMVLL